MGTNLLATATPSWLTIWRTTPPSDLEAADIEGLALLVTFVTKLRPRYSHPGLPGFPSAHLHSAPKG